MPTNQNGRNLKIVHSMLDYKICKKYKIIFSGGVLDKKWDDFCLVNLLFNARNSKNQDGQNSHHFLVQFSRKM